MDCLKNLIGIYECGDRSPNVKYINDLPGFELSMADYLTGQQRQTGIEVLQACINNAADEIEIEVRNFLGPRTRFGSIIGNARAGYYDDNKPLKSADVGYYGGMRFRIGADHYLAFHAESITVFTPNTLTNQNIYIYDLTQGRLIDTILFSSTGDEYTEIAINKLYKSNGQFLNLFICHDAVSSYKASVIPNCGTCGWREYPIDGYLFAQAAKLSSSATPVQNQLQESSHSYGISVKYQLHCDLSNFICQVAPRLKMAMFYKSGMKWCDEIIYGKRLNSLTTVQKPDAEALKKDYVINHENAMSTVLQNMALPNDICFQCDPIISVRTSIP